MRNILVAVLILTTPSAVSANPYKVNGGYTVTRGYAAELLPKKESAPLEKLELLYLTTPGCWTCTLGERVIESDWLPSNWRGKIRILHDVNEVDKYGATRYPTWVLVRGNKELGRINPPNQVVLRDFVSQGLNLYNSHAVEYSTVEPAAQPTPMAEVNRVLGLLPQPDVGYVDFGCGDGRWLIAAARKWPNTRITGIEIDPARAAATRERIRNEGLEGRIAVITGDATTVAVQADVATMYLYPDVLEKLRPRLTGMKAFASYMHAPSGLSYTKNGDTFFYSRPLQAQAQVQAQPQYQYGGAVWEGQVYSGPVCNSPNCMMCNSIRRQLGR